MPIQYNVCFRDYLPKRKIRMDATLLSLEKVQPISMVYRRFTKAQYRPFSMLHAINQDVGWSSRHTTKTGWMKGM